jgi:asparagine synthase (glutamine-hydrolysing)
MDVPPHLRTISPDPVRRALRRPAAASAVAAMCGIVGVASPTPVEDREWLAAGRDTMSHRGPDDAGEWWSDDRRVGFGHRRLSILDLSPGGHQPMQDAGGTLTIVFNGEIYNHGELRAELQAAGHAFHTQSDTEVVLAAYRAWGADCLARLNGMFAIALHDRARGTVLLARDRAGEKPLFYTMVDGALRFASELKALLADGALPRRVDRVALDCYLAGGFVPGDRCILDGVHKLPPAHAMLFDVRAGSARVWRYWTLPHPEVRGAGDAADPVALLDELESLLADAVRRQLVADVPVGVLLSGGMDSSLVTAMAVRAASRVKTFTVRFPGHARHDETAHARLVADHFGTDHLELDAGETTVELLPQLARQFDEPIVDSSMIPTFLVSRLTRAHCTVALGGDGGDELFGGYEHYSRLLWLHRRARRVPRPVRAAVGALSGRALPVGVRGRNWLQALAADFDRGVPTIASYFDLATRRRLLRRHARWPLHAESVREARAATVGDLLDRATRVDFENYLAEDILVKVDRASMLASLEVRAPMLDHRIIEFAFGKVPSHLKATATGRKLLLRRLAQRVLPPAFDQQRKQGFSIPLASWLESGPWQRFFADVLLDEGQTTFDRDTVQGLLAGQARGRNNGERLFALVMFELWRREYGVTV